MPLRRIKEMSEYEDLNENTDITKSKPKDLVAGAEVSAELVGFKDSSESKIQMIENEDATRNDLPSLQKRGELLTAKKNPTKESSEEGVEEENSNDEKRTDESRMPSAFEEKDKYSVRLDDALAKLDELEEESVEIKEKEENRDKTRREFRLDSVSKYRIDNSGKMPIAGKGDDGREAENSNDKGVLDLKAELDQLQLNEKDKLKSADDDDKSISESDAGSTVTSPKRVCNVSDLLFTYSRTPNIGAQIVGGCKNYNMLIFWI